jgi:pimeloyl-ACP methyl ester carboxylesterase
MMNLRAMLVSAAVMLALFAGCGAKSKGPEGDWQGKLKVPGGELTIVIHITKGNDGKLAGTLDSPDQDATGIAASEVTFAKGKLSLKVASIGGSYQATMGPGDSVLTGTWQQGMASLPLELRRGTVKAAEMVRPQEPKPPFPYKSEEVTVDNAKAGLKLAGTLTMPDSGGPFPAVVLITGSGAEDRNEAVFGHKPFLVLADYLTRRGIAVLRCDDRGVGKSTGDYSKATTADLATDALVQVEFLKTCPGIDPAHIGLIGHSEGGVIAPIVANESKDVAFVVLMAGTGVRGDSVLILQGVLVSKSMGVSDSAIAEATKLQRQVLDIARSAKDTAQAAPELRALLKGALAEMSAEDRKALEFNEESVEAQVMTVLSPWFRYFLGYDPQPALRSLKVPVLAINGSKDVQVAPEANLPAIEAALKAGGNKDYTVKELPGLNHLFQHATTGAVTEYSKSEETIAPDALAMMGDWILAHARPSGR